jgi:hypothetical protein
MRYLLLALSLALTIVPAAAPAADNPAPPSSGASAQGWPGHNNFGPFMRQEEQLHKQFRSQALAALSTEHRNAIGGIIGSMAVSASPDPRAAAQQIDGVLSQSEQQAILSARNTFQQQSRALHDQMRSQMTQSGASPQGSPRPMRSPGPGWNDAGSVLLMALQPGPGMHMMHGHGGPPNGASPNGPPPDGGPPNGGPPPRP